MSPLVGIHELSKAFGTQTLFQGISFGIQQGDQIGLIGPNGSGKSTLLEIIAGIENPDSGHLSRRQGLRLGFATQAPEFAAEPLETILVKGLRGDPQDLQTRARILLGKVGFEDAQQNAATLSGGWKKRLDIARALMQEPDLMLFDEPTNHLDLEGIVWLENFLKRERLTYIVISHDRYFLENVTNKIIELNKCFPQGIFVSEGPLSTHMELKENFLEGQGQQERALANIVRDEIDWLRRSPKARTTKSTARIQRANELIGQLAEVRKRNKKDKVALDFSASERETRKLLVGKNLTKSLGDKLLFKGIDLTLSPGSCVGIVGANGTGKTTLLRLLAGQIAPDMGTLKVADDLKLVYFDQHREQIPPNVTLRRALSPLSDTVNYRGQSIHVNGWAKKFLFTPDRMELPIGCLSGGERARILIARLMLQPADILFLDEPTNDLDIPTLEVIEESIQEFTGAVVLISHDRCMMDRICTQFLGLGAGLEGEIFADFAQWEAASQKKSSRLELAKPTSPPSPKPSTQKKLTYKEQRELEGMEETIQKGEAEIQRLQILIESSSNDPQKALELYQALHAAQSHLDQLFARWEELESKRLG